MNPWIGIGSFIAALIASILIRSPHERRSKESPVAIDRVGGLERALLVLMLFGALILPFLYWTTPLFNFANYPLHPLAFGAGLVAVAIWLYMFYRAHTDLGTNWSVSLQVREQHEFVQTGIYAKICHPMYTALFGHGFAQALLMPNWLAGPSMLLAFTIMFACRLRPEEQLMIDRFGDAYCEYLARTKRLIPGIW